MANGAGVFGPYPFRGGFRVMFRLEAEGSLRTKAGFESEEEARAWMQGMQKMVSTRQRSVGDAIASYRQFMDEKASRDEIREKSASEIETRLNNIMADVLDLPLKALTSKRCEALYEGIANSGKIAASTHQGWLDKARSWGRWCVKKGWFKATSPWATVDKMGKRKNAKGNVLREDQVVKFNSKAVELWQATGDDRYIAPCVTLNLGPRPNEVVRILAHDVNSGGKTVYIGGAEAEEYKTETTIGARTVGAPWLQQALAAIAKKRKPTEKLWPHDADVVNDFSKLICAAADLPPCNAFKLRRSFADLMRQRGSGLNLALVMGHGADPNARTATRHYVAGDTIANADAVRAQEVLAEAEAAISEEDHTIN